MNKKKKLGIFLAVTLVLILIVIGVLFWWQNEEDKKKQIADIKSHYSETVVLLEDANLYTKENDKYQEVCKISKDMVLHLKSQNIESTNDTYFAIEETPYYLYYKNVQGCDTQESPKSPYLVFNENIITKANAILLQDDQEKIILPEGASLKIMEKGDENYTILFQNQMFKISKESVQETQEVINTEEEELTNIPVLHYDLIDAENLKRQLTELQELGYTSISWSDLLRWQQGVIRFNNKKVLLLFNTLDKERKSILEEANAQGVTISETGKINWVHKNERMPKDGTNAFTYKMSANTTKEELKSILDGTVEPIAEESILATQVPVLNYHFFYNGEEGNFCRETICLDNRKFEQHLQYLKDNGFTTLTMEEYRAWMYDETNLPQKSVLITVDDGAMGTSAINGNILIPALEKYDLKATLFLITAWWDLANYQSENLDVESHGYDIHVSATCDGTSKAKALCLSKDELVTDLNKSIEILGTKKAFCYPFYAYNNTVISATQESGFALGFAGGGYKSTRQSNKYAIPRYPIYDSITLEQFIRMVN